jgi:hypothetical protein
MTQVLKLSCPKVPLSFIDLDAGLGILVALFENKYHQGGNLHAIAFRPGK